MNKFLIPIVVVLVLALGAFGYLVATKQVVQPVGAVTGPEDLFPYHCTNGVCKYYFSSKLTQFASTTCSFKTPGATTTLDSLLVQFNVASSSATIIEVGRSAGPMATTTLIGTKYNIPASGTAVIDASTSPAAGDARMFGPNTYLNIKIGGGISTGDSAGTGFIPTGACRASFTSATT